MLSRKKIKYQVANSGIACSADKAIDQKLLELEALLSSSDFDSEKIRHYKQRINDALELQMNSRQQLEAYRDLDKQEGLSQFEHLDKLITVLSQNPIDTELSKRIIKRGITRKILLCIFSLLIMVIGFAMIIMPAPPAFEIYTVFYFNNNDGVTVMDLVSLLIIFGGIFLFIFNVRQN